MDPVRNPYSPGAGLRPPALVGREAAQESFSVALQRLEAGRGAQPLALYGLRGVGKTVLLSSLSSAALRRDWLVAQVEAGAGKPLREVLATALHGPLSDLARPSAGRRVLKALRTATSFRAVLDSAGSWSFGLDLDEASGGGADTGALETDLAKLVQDLSGATAELGCGLALLIDEAQDLSGDELVALCATAHQVGQQGWPCLFALAGLPSLPRLLAEAKSYAERLFAYHPVEHLPEDVARRALTEPASVEGVAWQSEAVDHVIAHSGGYPYFLQQFGRDTWQAAEGPDRIGLNDARNGVRLGQALLDAGFYRVRWERATPNEQGFLRAVAADGGRSSLTADIATRLGKSRSGIGPARANLIAKGIVYAPEHGSLAYTVPGMAEFIARQAT
ncbi:MAG TPA: ATP-binding protein [Sporichthyaceae bacterium]|nr:ATP-binding protein [Sporichthyaceae bacterium]